MHDVVRYVVVIVPLRMNKLSDTLMFKCLGLL